MDFVKSNSASPNRVITLFKFHAKNEPKMVVW